MKEKGKFTKFISAHLRELAAAVLLAAALALFGLWGFGTKGLSAGGVITAAAAFLMFSLGAALAVPKAAAFFSGVNDDPLRPFGERSGRRRAVPPIVGIIIGALFIRVALIAAAYLIDLITKGYHGTVFSTMEGIWLKSDTEAPQLIKLAESWYSSASDLAYPPLFPALVRGLTFLTGSGFASAMIISSASSLAAAGVIYALAMKDMGRRASKIAAVFALIMPAAVFFAAPVREALMLLLTASALLALRKEKFWVAAVFITLATLTKLSGVLLLVPFVAEGAAYAVRRGRERGREGAAGLVVKLALSTLVAILGAFGFVLMNRLVCGDWFAFTRGARPVPFMQTVSDHADMLFATFGKNNRSALGIWIPGLLYIFGALSVFLASARTLRTSYSLYFAVAFPAALCGLEPTSVPRLLTGVVVIPLALALLCDSRDDGAGLSRARVKAAVSGAALAVGHIFYLIMFVLGYGVR